MNRRLLPKSLRKQFTLAVTALAALMLASGLTAIYNLSTSATIIRQLAEERMARMQVAQDLVSHTLLIERESYQLSNAGSSKRMHESYTEIVAQLEAVDKLVNDLAQASDAALAIELHQSSQLFRNTANIVAQQKEAALQGDAPRQPQSYFDTELYRQAQIMVASAQVLNEQLTKEYRWSVDRLAQRSRDAAFGMEVLLVFKLLLAWVIARVFLGQHVLARLQKVSRSLRSREEGPVDEVATSRNEDEIDEMARAVDRFQEDRRQLAQRTAELVLARDAADAANKAKSVFLANMSHELRTPLNAILGFSSLMGDSPELSDQQRQNLAIINRSGQHLLTLINDVLEVAKIEAGRLQLEERSFDLGDMVREVTEMMRLRAREKGLALSLDQSSEFPRFIKGDPSRLRQILINLISNAVKFTDEGRVTLRLGVKTNSRSHLVIEVEDTGPGISDEDQRRLFQPFMQVGQGASKGGSGLGLSITRQFVQLMGGTISLQSAVGQGTLIRVELPLELPSDSEMVELTVSPEHREVVGLAPGQPRYRILIAEDQVENQLLLNRLMADLGFEVKVAENGEQCIRVFQEWHPALIWMDRHMPVMDGVEATRRIRQLPGGADVKIIAVTASAFKEQRQEMIEGGMDDFVAKPYRFGEIYACLAKHLGVRYTYRNQVEVPGADVPALSAESLKQLPEDMRASLKAAAETLDAEAIAAVIQQIDGMDSPLAAALTHRVKNFDYQGISAAIESSQKPAAAKTSAGT